MWKIAPDRQRQIVFAPKQNIDKTMSIIAVIMVFTLAEERNMGRFRWDV
jgi:hypothetical protein